MFIIALIIATVIPLTAFLGIRQLDLYRTGSSSVVAISFFWGMLAFGGAYLTNSAMLNAGLVSDEVFRRYTAPIVEEVLKGLFVIYLVRRPSFHYFVDGAIYGFAIGIGFAIIENYSYVIGTQQAAMGIAISRVLSTNLMHATGSALIGISLGYSRFERPGKAVAAGLAGLILALLVHIGFNNLVTRVSSSLLLIYAMGVGLGGVAFIASMIRQGLSEERTWIKEKLGEADRVTAGEAAVVDEFARISTLLEPISEQFGEDKARQVEDFLRAQAQLGIKRKMLDKLSDEKMLAAVQAQIDTLRVQMNEARQAVGAYTMLYVRNIFPPQTSPLWGQLDFAIAERQASRGSEPDAPSLWDTLGSRMAASSPSDRPDQSSSSTSNAPDADIS